METAQERELLHQRHAWWPLDTMPCSLETSSCSLFGWDPHLFYFGHGAIGNGASDSGSHGHHEFELVPKCMEFPAVSEASAAVTGLLTVQDAMAMPAELDELLQNLLDSDEEGSSSWCALKEASAMSLLQHDHHFNLSTVSPTVPTSLEKSLTPPQAELPSSSSSQGNRGPRASDTTSGAQCQTVGVNCSSKRWAPAAEKQSKGGESCKRSRTASSTVVGIGSSVARPFTVVKPSGADGEVTLADINKWILAPPARPVRHPVGELACAPRVLAGNRPAPSGKTVAGFTRVHTAGRGTVTVVRTIG